MLTCPILPPHHRHKFCHQPQLHLDGIVSPTSAHGVPSSLFLDCIAPLYWCFLLMHAIHLCHEIHMWTQFKNFAED